LKCKKELELTFNEYQKSAAVTAIYPGRLNSLIYPVIGLAGETGEVSEKVKKLLRDSDGVVTPEFVVSLTKELGDVLWYLSALCDELKISLEDVAKINLQKLSDRKVNNTVQGSGDDR
jgi:NTP pyrophosphatase (non-canonical NTP hydrolase)